MRDQNPKLFSFFFVAPQVAAAPEVPVVQAQTAPVVKAIPVQPQVYAANSPALPTIQDHPVPVVQVHAAPVQPQVYAPNAVPISLTNTQHHAQTESGAYSYGYSNALSSKQESKSEDGITQGTYSYVDANGLVQTVNYVSDVLGFRVSATNLPVAPRVPEVKSVPLPSEKTEAVEPVIDVRSEAMVETPASEKKVVADFFKTTEPIVAPAPIVQVIAASVVKALQPQVYAASSPTLPTVQDHPVPVVQVHAAPVQPQVYAPNALPISLTNTQHHAQTETGAYSYGYSNALSSKQESKSEDGITHGTYSYVDANGLVQTVNYVSDVLGFRVSATNLPVAPEVPEVKSVPLPSEPVGVVPEINIRSEALVETPVSEKKVVADFFKTTEPIVAPAPIVQAQAVPVVKSVPVNAHAYGAAVPVVPIAQEQSVPIVQAQVAQVQPEVYAAAVPVLPVVQYAPVPVVQAPAGPVNTQYHAQTESGAYSYGYGNALSSKQESKSEDGITQGTYSYVDANGLVQTVNYVSDALGFRVSATNLPVAPVVEDGPGIIPVEVKSAPLPSEKPAVVPELDETVIKQVQTPNPPSPQIVYGHSVYAPNAQPIDWANTQYHSQNEFGGYNYGYSNPLSSKSEFKSPDGITQGTYSYVDAYGLLQTVNYVSDALGFRVAATNLPVAPVATAENSYSTPAASQAPYDDAVYAVPVISQEKEEAPPATMVDVRIGKEIAEQSITQAHYHTQDEHGREDPTLLKKFFFIILDCTLYRFRTIPIWICGPQF